MRALAPDTDIVNIANLWFAFNTELLVARQNGEEEYAISANDLARYHPKLNNVIRELLDQKTRRNKPARLSGMEVKAALEILTNGGYTFEGIRGGINTMSGVYNITVNEFRGEAVLHGPSVELQKLIIAGDEVAIGSEATWATHIVSMVELEKRSPGWLQRLKDGQALGLEDQVLLQYTFPLNKPNFVVPDMSPITFDELG